MSKNLVIIPTYNEIENIRPMIEKVFSLELFDLLIVDDGSPDNTAAAVKEMMPAYNGRLNMVERSGKQGLGTAYIAGFRWALEREYDYIFEMDCDFSHNPDDMLRLLDEAQQGTDLVIGSRYIAGVNVINWPLSRLLLSYFASKYVRMVTGLPVMDATAGFVCYSRQLLQRINLDRVKMKGYGFQIEMKYTAWRLKAPIKEISIIFTERQEGNSKMSGGILREAVWGVSLLPYRKY
ncbi:MAG: polyprenol monophosphomannose synthase [Rikenellaceae bacterium]